MFTDPVADYLTRVRNAVKASHKVVSIPSSKIKKEITKVLKEQGFILDYKFVVGDDGFETIKIALKYDIISKVSAINKIIRVSRPGLRKYTSVQNLPKVINGLGIAVMSTPKGIMTNKEALVQNVGGEVVCYVY